MGWTFSQRVLRGFVWFLRKLKSKITQLTLTAVNYFKRLKLKMTNLKVLNLVLAQTLPHSSAEALEELLVVGSLTGLLPSGHGQMLSSRGCTTAQLHSSGKGGREGNPVAVSAGASKGCPRPLLPASAHLPWPCGCQRYGAVEMFADGPWGAQTPVPGVKFQPRESPRQYYAPGGNSACPLLTPCSHHCSVQGHSLPAAPKLHPGSPGPKVLKCHPRPLSLLFMSGGSLHDAH